MEMIDFDQNNFIESLDDKIKKIQDEVKKNYNLELKNAEI